jgi:hypothetical protein
MRMGTVDTLDCQTADLVRSSKKYPRVLTVLYQLRCNLKTLGLLGTSRKAWSKFVTGTAVPSPLPFAHPLDTDRPEESLNLQAGEWVEVRSEEEVRSTLDPNGKNRGLGFMPEMWPLCGQRARVLRKVEKICLEEANRTVRSMRNTVILEGLFCQGNGIGCDRACFYFWRECWLKRVDAPSAAPDNRSDLVEIAPMN